jgi:hypothetical protein
MITEVAGRDVDGGCLLLIESPFGALFVTYRRGFGLDDWIY